MPRVVGVMGPDLARGFALAGVDVASVADERSARQALMAAIESPGCGLVIVEQGLLDALEPREREALSARTIPLVIVVTGELRWEEGGSAPADDYVAALIRRAVGYQLTITF